MISRNCIICLFSFLLLFGCSISDDNRYKAKPKALGVMNEIVVITDQAIWSGMVSDTVSHYFEGYYPLTPRPEPIFDVRQFDVTALNSQPLKKELRTYLILADLSNESSAVSQLVKEDLGPRGMERFETDTSFRTSIGKDKWASGQILFYVFANSLDELVDVLVDKYEAISLRINEHDYEQLYQSSFARGENVSLTSEIFDRFGVRMPIPSGFQIAVDDIQNNGLLWMRTDYKDGTTNLILRKMPYTSPEQVSKEYIKDLFNQFGREHVSSPSDGSYVVVNDVDLPILSFDREISGNYTKEFRGIWEMHNDFMGGPFLSYAIVNNESGELFLAEGFVFSPGKKKREALQQLDLIVKNLQW